MFPAQLVVTALNKAGSVPQLARQMGVIDQTVYNWLNYKHAPSASRIDDLIEFIESNPRPKSAWELRQEEIEARERKFDPVQEEPVRAYKPDPKPVLEPKKSWKQRVEITRIHQNADYSFGVTDDALIVFIVPHVVDKLKDAGICNGDEVTLIVRENDHHAADLYAFKWVEEDE
jgi:hypothetical protein